MSLAASNGAFRHSRRAGHIGGQGSGLAAGQGWLTEAYRVIGEQAALIGQLQARVEDLERRAGRDSSTSSRPPSSDSPYKKPRDRSWRERGKRRPGEQPGEPGTTMKLIDDPDHRFWFPSASCRECGTALAGVPVIAQRRHQVTDLRPAPTPKVTEQARRSKIL